MNKSTVCIILQQNNVEHQITAKQCSDNINRLYIIWHNVLVTMLIRTGRRPEQSIYLFNYLYYSYETDKNHN